MMSPPVLTSFVILAICASLALAHPGGNQLVAAVNTINDLSKFRNLPQGVELISRSEEGTARGTILYTLGQRASNDRLVVHAADSKYWSTPQNVELRLQYPVSGTGALITYVECFVNQSSNSGQAYVTSGGIGQRSILMFIDAWSTTVFIYECKIYGV